MLPFGCCCCWGLRIALQLISCVFPVQKEIADNPWRHLLNKGSRKQGIINIRLYLSCMRGAVPVLLLVFLLALVSSGDPCIVHQYVQVYPTHSCGMGDTSSREINVSLGCLPVAAAARSATLDGLPCIVSEDLVTLRCPVAPVPLSTWYQGVVDYSVAVLRVVTRRLSGVIIDVSTVPLNATADGSFFRRRSWTPTTMHSAGPAHLVRAAQTNAAAPSETLLVWRPSLAAVMSPAVFEASGMILSAYPSRHRLDDLSRAMSCARPSEQFSLQSMTCRVPSTVTTGFFDIVLVERHVLNGTFQGSLPERRRRYMAHTPQLTADGSRVVMASLTLHPLVSGLSWPAAKLINFTSGRVRHVLLEIMGSFPRPSVVLPVVEFVALRSKTRHPCVVLDHNAVLLTCLLEVKVASLVEIADESTNDVDDISGFGAGAVVWNESTSEWSAIAPSSTPSGWSNVRAQRMASAVQLPNGTVAYVVHCTSSHCIHVRDTAGADVCSVARESTRSTNKSTVHVVSAASRSVGLDVVCCDSSDDSCSVSLEVVTEVEGLASDDDPDVVAVVELRSVTTDGAGRQAVPRRSPTPSHTRSEASSISPTKADYVSVTITAKVAAVVRPVESQAECESTLLDQLVVAGLNETSERFSNVSAGTWRSNTRRCHWHVVVHLASCRELLPLPLHVGSVMYCGRRRAFFDPIPWSMLAVPAAKRVDLDASPPCNSSLVKLCVVGRDVLVPQVHFDGSPLAVVAHDAPPLVRVAVVDAKLVADQEAPTLLDDTGSIRVATEFNATFLTNNVAAGGVISVAIDAAESISVAFRSAALVFADAASNESFRDLVARERLLYVRSSSIAVERRHSPSSQKTSWVCNITVPSAAESGVYRVVLFPVDFDGVTSADVLLIPPFSTTLSIVTASYFVLVRALLSALTTEAIGVLGGGIVTMRGEAFPTTDILTSVRLSLLSQANATAPAPGTAVQATMVLRSSSFMSWVLGDLSTLTGPRVLNTITVLWQMHFTHTRSGLIIQRFNGTLGVLQAAALPRIASVTPLHMSALESPVFTVVGTFLNLRTLSVCPNGASEVPVPYIARHTQTCELCVPTFSSPSLVVCRLQVTELDGKPILRRGRYAMYVSAMPQGGSAYNATVLIEVSVESVLPAIISPFGGALLTVFGAGFVDAAEVWLRPKHANNADAHPCIASERNGTTIVCRLYVWRQAAASPMVVFLVHSDGTNITCDVENQESCVVSVDTSQLPKLLSVSPRHGQAPLSITVYGLGFTGNSSWLEPELSNLALTVGGTRCIVEPPVFYDRIICRLADVCESTSPVARVTATLEPYGSLETTFTPNLRFVCHASITSVWPVSGSCMGGQNITIDGHGFSATTPPVVSVAGVPCSVRSYTSTRIVCRTGSLGTITDHQGAVTVSSVDSPDVVVSCCMYQYSARLTPTVVSVAPTTGSEGVRVTIVGTGFVVGVEVEMGGVLIPNAVILERTSINMAIPRLPPSSSRLRLRIVSLGYAYHAPTLENFTYAMSITLISPSRVSMNSGLNLVITGTALAITAGSLTGQSQLLQQPSTKVLICGRECPIVSAPDFNNISCAIPSYVDQHTLQQFPGRVGESSAIRSEDIQVWRRTAEPGGSNSSWVDATELFTPAATAIAAAAGREVFLIAAVKHARVALKSLSVALLRVRNISQNVSCSLQKPAAAAPLESLNPLDATVRDWADTSLWGPPSLVMFPMLNGNNTELLATLYDAARYFLLSCSGLVAGDTMLARVVLDGALVGVASSGGVCPLNIVVASASGVYESCSDPRGTSCATIAYDSTITPIVVASSVPYSVVTAPTRVTLTGSGFGLVADNIAPLVVGGMDCAVQLAQESSVVCVTQGRFYVPSAGGRDTMFVAGRGRALMIPSEPLLGAELWSAPSSWRDTVLPEMGSIVFIPQGCTLLLDQSPPYLVAIIVEGTLVIADVTLRVSLSALIVHSSGVVQGGGPTSLLRSQIVFTFVNDPILVETSSGAQNFGSFLLVDGGSFRLHGSSDSSVVSSLLQHSALAGSTSVTIQDRVSWLVGSVVVITASTPNAQETEERVIVGRTLVGSSSILDLDAPLQYRHDRGSEFAAQQLLETTARVVLLSRNVVLQGSSDSAITRIGVSLHFRDADVTLSYVMVRYCGKSADAGHGAQAAVVFESIKAIQTRAVAVGVIVHRSYYRGFVIQRCEQLQFTNNIIYRTMGHGVATVGGDSWQLTFASNLVIRSESDSSTQGDLKSSNFYLTNPTVSMSNNIATDASGDAVWFDVVVDAVVGPLQRCPSHYAVVLFVNNELSVAGGSGLRIGPASSARSRPCVDSVLGSSSNPFILSSFASTVIYGCLKHGVDVESAGSLSFARLFVVDCGRSSVRLGSVAGAVSISDSLMSAVRVDGTSAVSVPRVPRVGLDAYAEVVSLTLTNVNFRNYSLYNGTPISVCSMSAGTDTRDSQLPALMSSSKITVSGINISAFAVLCGSVVLLDSDGSLTQLSREVYLVSGGMRSLSPEQFTMCRPLNNTEMPAATRAMFASGGPDATLLLCETSSTYSFFAVTVQLLECGLCTSVRVVIQHSGAELADFILNTTDTLVGTKAVTILAVDGRPSTVSALSSIFSSRMTYAFTPLCLGGTACEPAGGYILSRAGTIRPQFPFQTILYADSLKTRYIDVFELLSTMAINPFTGRWRVVWQAKRAVLAPVQTAATESPWASLQQRSSRQGQLLYITAAFSTVATLEAIQVVPHELSASLTWQLTSLFPHTLSDVVVSTVWTNSSFWPNATLPSLADDAVTIPQGTVVRLNVRETQVQALVIFGTLVIDADWFGDNLTISCTQLLVFGSLLVSASSGRFSAAVHLTPDPVIDTSTASNSSVAPHCAVNRSSRFHVTNALSFACGDVLFSGNVTFQGSPRPTWWAAAEVVPSGSTGFPLPPAGRNLVAGWRVGLTTTDTSNVTGETNVLVRNVTSSGTGAGSVARPWQRTVRAFQLQRQLNRFAEAAVLSRSAELRCVRSMRSSCTIVTRRVGSPASLVIMPHTRVQLSFTSVRAFGRLTGTAALPAMSLELGTVSLDGVVIEESQAGAITVASAVNASISQTIVWGTVGSAVVVLGNNTLITTTLVAGVKQVSVRESTLCGILVMSSRSLVTLTTVAGSEGEGFCLPWTTCSLDPTSVSAGLIVAHSCANGVFLFSLPSSQQPCRVDGSVGAIESYGNSFVGVVSTDHTSILLTAVAAAQNPIGLYLGGKSGHQFASTRVTQSSISGMSSCSFKTWCSPSLVNLPNYDCTTLLFQKGFQFVGILLASNDMTSVPLTYRGEGIPLVSRSSTSTRTYNLSAVSTVTVASVSFLDFQSSCGEGVAIAFNPLSYTRTFPLLSTSALRLDNVPRTLFASVGSAAGACYDSSVCNPAQAILVDDVDGSVRASNSTAIIIGAQSAAELLSCSAMGEFSVCSTTLFFGLLTLRNVGDDPAFPLGCALAVGDVGGVAPSFGGCVAATRGTVFDMTLTLLVVTGASMTLKSSFVPRSLDLTLQHCTLPAVVFLQLQETDMRLSVWVDGERRTMGSQSPSLTSRNGEWYRNPLLVGDDVTGDENDWVAVKVACGATVRLHHIVFAKVVLTVNTTIADLRFGQLDSTAAVVAALSGRPRETVFVASMLPSTPSTQAVVEVRLEARDTWQYNASFEADSINSALEHLVQLTTRDEHRDYDVLSSALGYLVFSMSITRVTNFNLVDSTASSLLTLQNVLLFTFCVAGLAGAGAVFYWYLLGLRYRLGRKRKQYTGLAFGAEVPSLPDTDLDAMAVDETIPETCAAARLIDYVHEWRVVVTKGVADFPEIAFDSSMHSNDSLPVKRMSDAGRRASHTHEAPNAAAAEARSSIIAKRLSVRQADLPIATPGQRSSIVSAFLFANECDPKMSSARLSFSAGEGTVPFHQLDSLRDRGLGAEQRVDMTTDNRPQPAEQHQLKPFSLDELPYQRSVEPESLSTPGDGFLHTGVPVSTPPAAAQHTSGAATPGEWTFLQLPRRSSLGEHGVGSFERDTSLSDVRGSAAQQTPTAEGATKRIGSFTRGGERRHTASVLRIPTDGVTTPAAQSSLTKFRFRHSPAHATAPSKESPFNKDNVE